MIWKVGCVFSHIRYLLKTKDKGGGELNKMTHREILKTGVLLRNFVYKVYGEILSTGTIERTKDVSIFLECVYVWGDLPRLSPSSHVLVKQYSIMDVCHQICSSSRAQVSP